MVEGAADRHARRGDDLPIDHHGPVGDATNEQNDRRMRSRHQRRESVVNAEVADVRDHGGAELVVGHAERTQIELQAVGREIDQRDHRLQQRRGCSQDRLLRSLGPVISGVDPLYRIRQLRRQLGDRFSVGRDDLDPRQVATGLGGDLTVHIHRLAHVDAPACDHRVRLGMGGQGARDRLGDQVCDRDFCPGGF